MLELKNVTFSVDTDLGKKTIIDNISLKIDEKFVAFTGPNGGGKSTLAKLIMGLYKPTSGKIYFDGQDITEMSITDRAKLGLGYAFQAPVKFKGITVSDLISIASGRKLNVTEICSYLSQVGLCAREYVNREVNNELSGGELKRIEIATAMAKSPKLTLFDEPEAGIDLWSFNNLISVFEKLEEQTNGSLSPRTYFKYGSKGYSNNSWKDNTRWKERRHPSWTLIYKRMQDSCRQNVR